MIARGTCMDEIAAENNGEMIGETAAIDNQEGERVETSAAVRPVEIAGDVVDGIQAEESAVAEPTEVIGKLADDTRTENPAALAAGGDAEAGGPEGEPIAPATGGAFEDGPTPLAPGSCQLIQIGGEKADLKAVREAMGINQIDLANLMNVTVRTIKRWEQIGWEEPPDEVWDLLFELVCDHESRVAELVEKTEVSARAHAAERRSAGRDPWIVELPYFKNQDHYEQFPHRKRSQHAWGNAISRRAADILRMKGYTVYFFYPEPGGLG